MTEIVRRKKRKRMKNKSKNPVKQGTNDRGHGKFVLKEKLMSSLNRMRN
jgi:hypothetical protein